MRLLGFSDLHRDKRQAGRLLELSREADVVIGAGDFASMRLGLNDTIEALESTAAPAVLTPGNNETDAELRRAYSSWTNAIVLHGTGTEIAGVGFFGRSCG